LWLVLIHCEFRLAAESWARRKQSSDIGFTLSKETEMADVINGTGTIILDGTGVADAVAYWLTISEEPGAVVAEGSISASEDLLRKVNKADRATMALEDGPPLALKCVGGSNGVRWVKALRD
jgi:hypothetical protein